MRVKDGTRVQPTEADQAIFFGKALVGYVEAESGRQLAIAIFAGDVPVPSAQDIFPTATNLTEEQDELAVAIQQGY